MALNDHPSIGRTTKARILEVQRRTGYRPNRHARMMRRRTHSPAHPEIKVGNIAFLLIDRTFEDPAYAPMFQGVFDAASKTNLHLFYHSLKREELLAGKYPPLIRDHEVDGLIISGVCEEAEHRALKELAVPKILLGVYDVHEPTLAVEVDLAQGMRALLERLHAMGHRRVAFLSEDVAIHAYKLIVRAYENESQRLWGTLDRDLIQVTGRVYEGGYEAARRALSFKDRPTALVLATERLGVAAYDVCAEFNLRIPQDCSIVAFGAGGHSYHYRPTLALVEGDAVAMGRAAVNNLLESLGRTSVPPHRTVFPMQIREGQSWGTSPEAKE
jgi:DNA-binding LacI/PurR family transcriptional regulator